MDIHKELQEICTLEFERDKNNISWKEFIKELEQGDNPYLFTRTAFQNLYDSIISFGTSLTIDSGEPIITYNLFSDPFAYGEHAIYGLERIQNQIVSDIRMFGREEAHNRSYGLIGPPGSCKTPHIDLPARGLEEYSTTKEGRLFAFKFRFLTDELLRDEDKPSVQVHNMKDKSAKKALSSRKDSTLILDITADSKADNLEKLLELRHDESITDIVVKGSYAHLPAPLIGLEFECRLREDPLHFISLGNHNAKEQKFTPTRQNYLQELFDKMNKNKPKHEQKIIPAKVLEQSLCKQCKEIWKILTIKCGGDSDYKFDHVVIEPLLLSEISGVGIGSISPDQSLNAKVVKVDSEELQKYLPGITAIKFEGKVINAQRGILHLHDFMKIEGSQVNKSSPSLRLIQNDRFEVESHTIETDIAVFWTSNDNELMKAENNNMLSAFFDRCEIRDVNYILNVNKEKLIYLDALKNTARGNHIAPHTVDVAAMWAILGRLEKAIFPENAFASLSESSDPDKQAQLKKIKETYLQLSPVEKMWIYSSRNLADVEQILRLPKSHELRQLYDSLPKATQRYLKGESNVDPQAKHLRELGVFHDALFNSRLTRECRIQHVEELTEICDIITPEFMKVLRSENPHEGKNGISPRKMQDIIREVIKNLEHACLNPHHIFEFIETEVIPRKQKYKLEWQSFNSNNETAEKDEYHPNKGSSFFNLEDFLSYVKAKYNGVVKKEVIEAMSEINETAIDKYLRVYFDNVRAFFDKNGKVKDDVGKWHEPNEALMRKVEEKLNKNSDEDRIEYRTYLLQELGDLRASGLLKFVRGNPSKIEYKEHFPELYEKHRADERTLEIPLEKLKEGFITFGTKHYKDILKDIKHKVEWTLDRLAKDGYCNHCAKDTVVYAIDNGLVDELAPENFDGLFSNKLLILPPGWS